MARWKIRNEKTGRNEFWTITESVHSKGRVYLNLVRGKKVKTVRIV